MTYEFTLRQIASTNVGPIVYPTPTATIEDQITAKLQDINDLKQEKVARPSPKSAYLELLEQLEQGRQALIDQNDQIVADNAAARKTAEDNHAAAIVAEMEKPAVITQAQMQWIIEDYQSRIATIEDWILAKELEVV